MPSKSPLYELYFNEPAGRFGLGHVLAAEVHDGELDRLQRDDVGRWHCDLTNHDALTWSNKVYEMFGVPQGAPVAREEAVARYRNHSRGVLERLRSYAINHKCGFILDAEISPRHDRSHWIRILAVPVFKDGRAIGLQGLKRIL